MSYNDPFQSEEQRKILCTREQCLNLPGYTWEQLMSFIRTTGAFTSVFWFGYNWTLDTFYYAGEQRENPPQMDLVFKGSAFIMMVVALGMGFFSFVITHLYTFCCKQVSDELAEDTRCYTTFIHIFTRLRDISIRSIGPAAGLWATFEQAMALQDRELRTAPLRFELVAIACATLSFILLLYETILSFKGSTEDQRKASALCGLVDTFQAMLGKSICSSSPLWAVYDMLVDVILPLIDSDIRISSHDKHIAAIAALSLSGFEGLRNFREYTAHPGLQKLKWKLKDFCGFKHSRPYSRLSMEISE